MAEREKGSSLASLPIRTLMVPDQDHTLMISFNLDCFLTYLSPNIVTFRVRASIYESGDTIRSIAHNWNRDTVS